MTTMKLEKQTWQPYFDQVSKSMEGSNAMVEVISLDVGDQVESSWLPIYGMSYDPHSDAFFLTFHERNHQVRAPTEIYVKNGGTFIEAIELTTADQGKQIIKFREPLKLPESAA